MAKENKLKILILSIMALVLFSGCSYDGYNLDSTFDEYCIEKGYTYHIEDSILSSKVCYNYYTGQSIKLIYNDFNEWYYLKYGCGHQNTSSSCEDN